MNQLSEASGTTTLDVATAKARMAVLDAPPRLDLRGQIQAAAALRVRPTALVRELTRAIRGPGRLTLHEFFYYRLYDPSLPRDEARRHVGKRGQARFHAACNDPRWFAAAHDKALFYSTAAGAGLPVPRSRAVYVGQGRGPAANALAGPDELEAFLRDAARYPLFMKPIEGMYSVGALSLAALEGDQLRFTTGATASLKSVVRFVANFDGGYLIQDRLEPHPLLRAAFGGTLPTVRLFVLLSPNDATIESAVLKIPAMRNPADNYWRAGNMLGALDRMGTVQRVITGVGAGLRECASHPDTGVRLTGLAVPKWQRVTELCRQAASMFPGIRTQSWDVALTDAGPVVLELNFGGDLNLHQLAHRRGALTDRYVAHLRRCGYRRFLPRSGAVAKPSPIGIVASSGQ